MTKKCESSSFGSWTPLILLWRANVYTCFSSCPLLKALKPQRLQWKGTSQVSRCVFKMWKTNGVFSFTSPQATHRYTWPLLERGSCRWKGHKPFWLPMLRALVVVHWLYYFLLLFPVDDSLLFIIGYMLICCDLLWVALTCSMWWTLCGVALWYTPNYTTLADVHAINYCLFTAWWFLFF